MTEREILQLVHMTEGSAENVITRLPSIERKLELIPEAYEVGVLCHPEKPAVPIATYADLLNSIKSRREEMKFQADQFAMLLGMDPDKYMGIESGKDALSLKLMLRICRMLKLNINIMGI